MTKLVTIKLQFCFFMFQKLMFNSGKHCIKSWMTNNSRWKDKRKLMVVLLLSRFSHVRLCATPQTAAHQAPPFLGFSRQEHWGGLPFPSPMHESEKWKGSRVRLLATPWTAAHQAPLSMELYRQEHWSGVPLPSLYIVTAAAAASDYGHGSFKICLKILMLLPSKNGA